MKGQLTVFFSLIVTLILSLITVCIQGAIKSTIAMQTECVVDMGLDSVFAEYNKELLEQYDLFFIDTSYGFSSPSIANTENRLHQFLEYNIDPQKDNLILNSFDWNQMEIVDVMVTNEVYATDKNGQEFKKQAIEHMKNFVGLNEISYVKAKLNEVNQDGLLERELDFERQELHNIILKEEEKVNEENIDMDQKGKWDGIVNQEDATVLNNAESVHLGILSLVIKETATISKSTLSSEELLSTRISNSRSNEEKRGSAQDEKESDAENEQFGMAEEILFVEYLLSKFHNYAEGEGEGDAEGDGVRDADEDNGVLQYELEYLLGGKESDVKNLKKVVHSMLLMREVSNYLYLQSDQEKLGEADVLAWTFGVVTLNPEMQPTYKQLILLSWAYGEGLLDVRELLNGGKIPLKKTRSDWKLGLSNLFSIGFDNTFDDKTNDEKEDKGLDYKMYLRLLLLTENKKNILTRSMNLVEANIRKTEGNSEFRLDGCVGGMSANVEMKGKFGFDFIINRKYSYCNSNESEN